MTNKPKTRVALIAGGSGGIGKAVSRALAGAGLSVRIGASRNLDAADALAREICSSGGRAHAVQLDLLDPDQIDAVCERVFESEGRLDILVNCAAINSEAPAAGMADETWREVMAVNLDGAFRLCRSVSRFMIPGRWGRIINFSCNRSTPSRQSGSRDFFAGVF